MPRFEYKKGTSSKFWEIDLEGKSCTVTFGRIGTAGTSKSRRFENDGEARQHYDQLIQEKKAKGYRAVVDRSAQKNSRAKTSAPVSKTPKSRSARTAPSRAAGAPRTPQRSEAPPPADGSGNVVPFVFEIRYAKPFRLTAKALQTLAQRIRDREARKGTTDGHHLLLVRKATSKAPSAWGAVVVHLVRCGLVDPFQHGASLGLFATSLAACDCEHAPSPAEVLRLLERAPWPLPVGGGLSKQLFPEWPEAIELIAGWVAIADADLLSSSWQRLPAALHVGVSWPSP